MFNEEEEKFEFESNLQKVHLFFSLDMQWNSRSAHTTLYCVFYSMNELAASVQNVYPTVQQPGAEFVPLSFPCVYLFRILCVAN